MLGNFTCSRFRFLLKVLSPLRLSAFAGATLRGGFGHLFKRTVCVWPPADCPKCLVKNTCAYPYIFETSPPTGSEKLRGLDQIPRPFIIEAPVGNQRFFQAGEILEFHLVLIGRGLDYLPYFILTFSELGKSGLGPGNGIYEILEVQNLAATPPVTIYAAGTGFSKTSIKSFNGDRFQEKKIPSSRIQIQFQTPTRIKSEGSIRAEIGFQEFIRALLRRISSLCYFHCGSELTVDFKDLISQAEAIKVESQNLHWQGQDRFSGRQKQTIHMGGVVGTIIYKAPHSDDFIPFAPLLHAGQWTHVGKGAVMGLGKYSMEPLT